MTVRSRPRQAVAEALSYGRTYNPDVGASVDEVRAQALRLFRTRQSAEAFLHAPCAALDGVPLDLATRGRASAVLFYLQRLERFAAAEARSDWVPGYRPAS